ncbi:MAG TPA: EAL domain-containing protein [Beijerinckiaceae bacterium]|jgi:diguanylate cyclase (GGDEF)-like protein/PAS domain S-box-containing protein|nr:EAL domain-containing protein [Beijerinckiaceae bacterium]
MSLIVIVDDRITNRNIFAKLAASIEPNVQVETFGDPLQALDWLVDQQPDLIITDFKMPTIDGAEFIRRYRQFPGAAEIPIIVLTIYEERSFRLRALEAGATDFLHSPVDHHEFVTRARNLLKLHKHQKLLADRATTLERELERSERSREQALRDSSERLAQVIDTLPVMINATASDGTLIFANAYQAAFSGKDLAKFVGKPMNSLYGPEQSARNLALDRLVLQTGKAVPAYEEEMTDLTGTTRHFVTTKSPLTNDERQVTAVLTSSLDITARKRSEAYLRHVAHHDALTDLPNRISLIESMRKMITRSRRGDHMFGLYVVDLDGFKKINDLLGHAAGDRYLKALAEHVSKEIREGDVFARLGGDEFALLQSDMLSTTEAADYANRILDTISGFEMPGHNLAPMKASIGVALYPSDATDADQLLINASLAMYRAKSDNGNSFAYFASDMQTRARVAAQLDNELQLALERGEFQLYYQPQINLATGQVDGAEALLRWDRPGQGIVSPGVFLPRAEENGMILPINEWVLFEACRAARRWQEKGHQYLRVAINLSPIQFRKRTIPLLVTRALGETGLDPRRLELELTESIVMQNIDAVADDLRQLMDMGVHISIDDFGTGYSSLGYVKQLPLDRLKIDQSFVRTVATDPNDAAIVRAITTLGKSLNMQVLAEGVETEEQLQRLRAEGCDHVQGFYFAKPMPEHEFLAYLVGETAIASSA